VVPIVNEADERLPAPATLAQRLRAAGQRVTPQRLLVLGAFAPGEHLTADEVYARVEALSPVVNRSTIYRTLEHFRDLGLLSETDLGGGARQFELLESGRHHHLVCRACGQLLLLDDDLVHDLREAIDRRYGFAARVDHLALFGRCKACRQDEEAAVATVASHDTWPGNP
jgi:Fur family ferric uptake transcriptional regulator